jgi:mannose-1-phosphate guanylyltransferase
LGEFSVSKSEKPVVLILAGGKGERFWPRSRETSPKQLQKVYSNKTLLRETIDRALTITDISRVYIGTNQFLKKAILKIESKFPKDNFIIEPEGKNTAPIIALASLYFERVYGDPIQIVLSADAYVNPISAFTENIYDAIQLASESLVLLGASPTRPETGYGYISVGSKVGNGFKVKSFHEKPDLKNAVKFLKKKNFFWNPGIFVWKNSVILSEFDNYAPYILNPLKKSFPFSKKEQLESVFKQLPGEAVDTAIMEKSTKILMVKTDFQWDDVGSWLSLERVLEGDTQNNFHVGKKSYHFKSGGNISLSKKEMVVFLGVHDLILVEEDDVILVSSKKGITDIKLLLAEFKKNKDLQKYLK